MMGDPDFASEIIGITPPEQPDPRWQVRVRALSKSFNGNLVLDPKQAPLHRSHLRLRAGSPMDCRSPATA